MTDTDRPVVNFTPSGKPVTHGGAGTAYTAYGCRCNLCTDANRKRVSRRRLERNPSEAPDGSHGKLSTYRNWNCRCWECKQAGAEGNRSDAAKRGEAWALK